MTFSIVASDGSAWGVAVASKFLAVGCAVPAAAADAGAIATQSYANLAYRPDGLGHLRSGKSAQETLDALTAADDGREQRQAGIVDTHGNAATYTGSGCHDWAGGRTGASYAIQGNILTGPEVVAEMERAWLASEDAPFAQRLFAGLAAGDAAGGDARGRQSAALYAVQPGAGYDGSGVLVDLRVDDHGDPVTEVGRLLGEWEMVFGHAEDVLPLEGDLADEVRGRLAQLGHTNDDVATALADWAGIVNYESRLSPEGIDSRVLDALRAATPS